MLYNVKTPFWWIGILAPFVRGFIAYPEHAHAHTYTEESPHTLHYNYNFAGRSCDEGKSFLSEVPDSPATAAYKNIIESEFELGLLQASKNAHATIFML